MTSPRWEGLPFETKVGNTTPFDDDLFIEEPAGSGLLKPLDLTGATVVFMATKQDGTVLFSGAATTTARGPATAGKVRFVPSVLQMTIPEADDYRAEWQIAFSGGQTTTVPLGNAYRRLIVGKKLG